MAKILLIDDEGIVRGALKAVLSQQGHDVSIASSGSVGLASLKQQTPDLVILDRDLPGMTGSQVLEEIRKISPAVRVIVLTGNPYAKGEEKYRALGISAFLSKGIGIEALLKVVARETAPAAGRGVEAKKSGSSPSPERILVADDDESIRTILTRFLEGKGYQVMTASNGQEALDALPGFKPHLLLLDIDMPVLSGLQVLRRLRELPKPPGVIMISGNDDVEIARECMKEGACDYIAKPLNFEYLELSVWAKILTLAP